jgi:tetratricopeptide (TPR) repeat protein
LQRQTTIAVWCERIIEGGWLLALVFIPSYFSLLSSRHFEPDKATTLRAIVLVMLAAGIIRLLEQSDAGSNRRADAAAPPGNFLSRIWRRLNSIPLALPTIVYVLVFLFATITSVVPLTSFLGSYQRLQGTYTNLSYIGLATIIVLTLRRNEQLERLITVGILASLVAVGYGLVQHFQVDPLPWKGDVVSRVASTMGNSIFVAAYLIMIVPFALYRAITVLHAARRAPPTAGESGSEWGWALAYLLLIVASLVMVFGAIKFGAVVRTADLRYWWVYPGALVVAFGLYLLPTLRPHTAERITMTLLWPGIITVIYVLMVGFFFLIGQASGLQAVQPQPGRGGTDWPLWMVGAMLLVALAYGLFFRLPRRAGPPSRLFMQLHAAGMLVIAALLLITVFFTQSRGPWLGTVVGLFVFFTLLLIQAGRRARAEDSPRAIFWRNLLIGELALAIILGAFIAAFNLSQAPIFEELRKVPYIGRMGTLLDTSEGTTGEVRKLIWVGDDKAGGAVALITSNPLRTIIGWGPESMFVAYNEFYPPSLANVEARGASPDRSHEAYLDELVTKGVLGLISYLFVLTSFFALAWRLLRRTSEWRWQVLFIACIAVVISHSVEGFTGIPIVSTLMMLWVTMAVLVVAGALAGQYSLDATTKPVAEPADAAVPPTAGKPQNVRRSGQRGPRPVARGAPQGRTVGGRRPQRGSNLAGLAVYAIIILLAFAGVWFLNADNVYADMRFQQGQTYTDNPSASQDQQIIGTNFFLDALRMEPNQDFYYLNLGRSLMNITDLRRQSADAQSGQRNPNPQVEDLLKLPDASALQTFLLQQSPVGILDYAQAVLQRAYDLNPLNKDHYANLARLHNFWYSRFAHDPDQLNQAVDWYKRGHAIAPQDVVILNEYAGAVALQGSDALARKDSAAAQGYFAQSNQLLAESKRLDPRYGDTDLRMADILRIQGQDAPATDQYIALLQKDPHVLDSQLSLIIDGMRDQPDQLRRLRDSYAAASAKKPDDAGLYASVGLISTKINELPRAVEAYARLIKLQPQSLDAHRNFMLVLSDTQQYQQAAVEAQTMLTLSQQQQNTQQTTALQSLLSFFKTRAAGG